MKSFRSGEAVSMWMFSSHKLLMIFGPFFVLILDDYSGFPDALTKPLCFKTQKLWILVKKINGRRKADLQSVNFLQFFVVEKALLRLSLDEQTLKLAVNMKKLGLWNFVNSFWSRFWTMCLCFVLYCFASMYFWFSNGAANTFINWCFVFATGAAMLEKRERKRWEKVKARSNRSGTGRDTVKVSVVVQNGFFWIRHKNKTFYQTVLLYMCKLTHIYSDKNQIS